jgi:hypothetical protein
VVQGIAAEDRTGPASAITTERSCPGNDDGADVEVGVTVVICAYTEQRWEQTCDAVESAFDQDPKPAEVLLVVDHNAELAARARDQLPGVIVLDSDGPPGLSGARNTGLRAATQPVTTFLDDDARARPGWLASLVEPYRSSDVVATGGSVHPWWPGQRPRWLPPAFDWVVGCSYLGLPDSTGPVRNPIGANMSLRTRLALDAGGFNCAVGQAGGNLQRCDETEMVIRLAASRPRSTVIYVPAAAVDHHVGNDRLTFSYFVRRCWYEGISKATVVKLSGSAAGLQRERRHVAVVIPAALLRDLRSCVTADLAAFMRICMTIAGLGAATAGYVGGHIRQTIHRGRKTRAMT